MFLYHPVRKSTSGKISYVFRQNIPLDLVEMDDCEANPDSTNYESLLIPGNIEELALGKEDLRGLADEVLSYLKDGDHIDLNYVVDVGRMRVKFHKDFFSIIDRPVLRPAYQSSFSYLCVGAQK